MDIWVNEQRQSRVVGICIFGQIGLTVQSWICFWRWDSYGQGALGKVSYYQEVA